MAGIAADHGAVLLDGDERILVDVDPAAGPAHDHALAAGLERIGRCQRHQRDPGGVVERRARGREGGDRELGQHAVLAVEEGDGALGVGQPAPVAAGDRERAARDRHRGATLSG